MLDPLVRHVRHVHESLEPAPEGDERAVGLEARHTALDRLADLECADVALAIVAALALLDELARHEHSLAFAVDLDHFAGQHLADQNTRLLIARQPGVRLRHERMQLADLELESLGERADCARVHEHAGLHVLPRLQARRFATLERPQALLAPAQREVELVSDARLERELAQRDHALHARAELDEDVVAVHADDRSAPHLQGVCAMVFLVHRIPPRFAHRATSSCLRC